MTHISVLPYKPGDEEELLERGLRPADIAEGWKTCGIAADAALRLSIQSSLVAGAIRIDGRVAALFGVSRLGLLDDTGIPWLVAHADFERPAVAVPMARIMRRFLGHWRRVFARLENYADPKHEKALRLLAWAGFSMRVAPAAGPLGHTLIHFRACRDLPARARGVSKLPYSTS